MANSTKSLLYQTLKDPKVSVQPQKVIRKSEKANHWETIPETVLKKV